MNPMRVLTIQRVISERHSGQLFPHGWVGDHFSLRRLLPSSPITPSQCAIVKRHTLIPVTAAYGISWAYLVGDVSFTTYKSSQLGPSPLEAANMSEPTRLTMVAVKRSVFQGVASMALPAFTIHTAVKQASKRFIRSSNPTLKRWGPTAVGISIVPALPYLFDEPVEHVVDYAFDKIEEAWFRAKPGGEVPDTKPKTDL